MGFVDDLESSIDIVELVGRYARLKKAGVNYKALCPFPGHSEKTPSFVVSPAKQIAYCFGCHKWWGPVKFIMDIENSEFRDAVQILGNITGKEIQGFTENKEKIEIKKNLYSLYKDAAQYYKTALQNTPKIQKYLIDRGLTQEDISTFHFWYADSGVNLYNHLKEKGYDDTLIQASHIFVNLQARRDKFIGRIIFPIQGLRWDFVAFAGRVIDAWEPKYINSPASDIYDKSSILYWLYAARTSIIKHDAIIITEGYMDTIALHRAGYTNSVAVSGTALTQKHSTMIKRLTHKVYLCFDNDAAGEKATKSALEVLKNKELEVRIIVLKDANDPDDFLRWGWDFAHSIDTALSPITYFIETNNYNLQSIDEKKKFLTEIINIIKSYADPIEQDSYLKEVSRASDTPVKILYEMLQRTRSQRDRSTDVSNIKKEFTLEENIMAYIYTNPELTSMFEKNIIFPEWVSPILRQVLQDPKVAFSSLDITLMGNIKALSLKYENMTAETQEHDQKKLIEAINKSLYKTLSTQYKQKIDEGDNEALNAFSELLKTAKTYGVK